MQRERRGEGENDRDKDRGGAGGGRKGLWHWVEIGIPGAGPALPFTLL